MPRAAELVSRRALLRGAAGIAGLAALAAAGCSNDDDSSPPSVLTSTDAYPDTGLLASISWLADRIDDPNLRLIDCSPVDTYQSGHLPRARHVWWQDTIEVNNPVYGMLTGPPMRAETVRETGIAPDSTVVCYDNLGGQYAARIVWMLHVQSFFNVRLLDGGRQAWQAAGHDLTDDSPDSPPGVIEAIQNESVIAQGKDIAACLNDPNYIIIDTRTVSEREETWYDRLRLGAISGSHHLPRTSFLTPDGHALLPPDELRARMPSATLAADAPEIIVYGLHGTLACLPYLALRALGYANVRVYDGSWAE